MGPVEKESGITADVLAGSGISSKTIRSELVRVLESHYFSHSARLSRFLRFAIDRALDGRSDQLKEYIIGLEVFDRKDSYDPRVDPIVRVEASRLRSKLKKYYLSDGKDDPIEIQIPVGSYAPAFRRKEAEAPQQPAANPPPGQATATPPWRDWKSTALIAGLAAVLAVTLALWISKREIVSASIAGPEGFNRHYQASIAILPLTNLSPGKDQEYFSAGLTEELGNALTGIPGLRVIPQSVTASLAGPKPDVRRIGRELNVAYVLEGSVRKDGDRLRITARVSDVLEGHTLWTETYENTIPDVFAVQQRISKSIVASLRGRLSAPIANPRI